jgi:flagellar biosynthesis chaperone FliJ
MQANRKIKRVQPLIRLKQTRVDEETAVLTGIRREKVQVVAEMKENQRRYMTGIEQLNQVRTMRTRDNIETLEAALDHVKAQWYRLYKRVQDIEGKEKAQITRLLTAERELKSVEKLQERYTIEARKDEAHREQLQLDEIALRIFSDR